MSAAKFCIKTKRSTEVKPYAWPELDSDPIAESSPPPESVEVLPAGALWAFKNKPTRKAPGPSEIPSGQRNEVALSDTVGAMRRLYDDLVHAGAPKAIELSKFLNFWQGRLLYIERALRLRGPKAGGKKTKANVQEANKLRDARIRKRYRLLRGAGDKPSTAIHTLAEDHSLSSKTISRIIAKEE